MALTSKPPPKKNKPQYKGLADFIHNASLEEKETVFKKVMEKSSEEQRRIIEQAKKLKE